MPVRIKVKQKGRVKAPQLDDPQLKKIGDAMVAAQKERWSKGVNADGNPAKKLSVRYAIIKQKVTHKRPIRDNNMTGLLIQNFALRKASQNTIRAENTTRLARSHAQKSNDLEQMIGLSGSDQLAIFNESQKQYGNWLQKAWIPIR